MSHRGNLSRTMVSLYVVLLCVLLKVFKIEKLTGSDPWLEIYGYILFCEMFSQSKFSGPKKQKRKSSKYGVKCMLKFHNSVY